MRQIWSWKYIHTTTRLLVITLVYSVLYLVYYNPNDNPMRSDSLFGNVITLWSLVYVLHTNNIRLICGKCETFLFIIITSLIVLPLS